MAIEYNNFGTQIGHLDYFQKLFFVFEKFQNRNYPNNLFGGYF